MESEILIWFKIASCEMERDQLRMLVDFFEVQKYFNSYSLPPSLSEEL